ncbi:MAG: hypothetical protein ACRDTD_10975 [Pseudonocardiaceae bacterium]
MSAPGGGAPVIDGPAAAAMATQRGIDPAASTTPRPRAIPQAHPDHPRAPTRVGGTPALGRGRR